MKLLIVTGIKECKEAVSGIFKESEIEVFSVSEIAGFRDGNSFDLADSWFGSGGDSFDSIMLFSFTESGKADKALQLIRKYNQESDAKFPIRGFILPVESYAF